MFLKVRTDVLDTTFRLIQIILGIEQIKDPEIRSVMLSSMLKETREFTTGFKTPIKKKSK